jgi:hypothetical protein
MRLESGLCLLLLLSCSNEPAAPKSQQTSPRAAHGDHSPQHGGLVLMHGDLHFEVLLDPEGHHRVYLTDAVRNELPASAASEVGITVLRPGEEPAETLALEIDEFGESWIARGTPVAAKESRALVSLVHEGERYEIELPFLAEPFDPEGPDPHRTHRP